MKKTTIPRILLKVAKSPQRTTKIFDVDGKYCFFALTDLTWRLMEVFILSAIDIPRTTCGVRKRMDDCWNRVSKPPVVGVVVAENRKRRI